MSFIELLLIAIGLAMDCFAVSFSVGAAKGKIDYRNILLLAFLFGFFQGGMPILGWLSGGLLIDHICHVDHWIIFAILVFIGGKMIIDALRPDREEKKTDITKPLTLLILAIATSIDALGVGFSFSMLPSVNIVLAVFTIGITSFLLSIFGVYIGGKASHYFRPGYAEIIGGVILVAIGTKILIEHLSA
ncbi:MAG TPA: manganese efflux pump MntP family protein [Bacteroidales bacterium]|jgi:putative Mn2+ efflux pump MntP|nr:manganese efflux pump MntP family protein [Bacteroidales bacterium]